MDFEKFWVTIGVRISWTLVRSTVGRVGLGSLRLTMKAVILVITTTTGPAKDYELPTELKMPLLCGTAQHARRPLKSSEKVMGR